MILTDFSKSSEKSYLLVHQQILIEWFPDDQDISDEIPALKEFSRKDQQVREVQYP